MKPQLPRKLTRSQRKKRHKMRRRELRKKKKRFLIKLKKNLLERTLNQITRANPKKVAKKDRNN